jgi:hypothetical protein
MEQAGALGNWLGKRQSPRATGHTKSKSDWRPLQQKHNNPIVGESYKQDFDLNPRESKTIDLISAFQGDNIFTIHHIVPRANQNVPVSGYHRLRVSIRAKDSAPPPDTWFRVWMDDKGILKCEMEPQVTTKPNNLTP